MSEPVYGGLMISRPEEMPEDLAAPPDESALAQNKSA